MTVKGYLDLSRGQLHYRMRDGQGAPIVCFHQTASSSAMFDAFIQAYPGPEPIYALDTPGFGGSYDPDDQPSMADYGAVMAEAIEAIGRGKAHLFGHHTGASLAVEVAANRPDLSASLAMIGPVTITREEAEAFKAAYPLDFAPKADGSHLKVMWEYIASIGGDSSLALHQREMADTVRAWQGHINVYSVIWDQDFSGLYQRVQVPMAILCGQGDVLWSVFERAKQMRPDAKVFEIGGTNFQPDQAVSDVAEAMHSFIGGL